MRLIFAASLLVCVAGCGQRSPESADSASSQVTPAASEPAPVTETPMPPPEAQSPVGAMAELKATQGNGVSGTLMLAPDAGGVHITGSIKGLPPGSTHGFHVHENGDCSAPDASSAGGHFNPSNEQHGNPESGGHHRDGMPNITADAEGTAELDAVVSGVTLRTQEANDVVGKSIVIHEKADDYKTQPSGDSGKRIACGIIK